jgi:hypothetical protein
MKNKTYTGQVSIGDKNYDCEVIDGVRYIDGKTVDEFYNTLPVEEIIKLAMVGVAAIENEKKRIPISPTGIYNNLNLTIREQV